MSVLTLKPKAGFILLDDVFFWMIGMSVLYQESFQPCKPECELSSESRWRLSSFWRRSLTNSTACWNGSRAWPTPSALWEGRRKKKKGVDGDKVEVRRAGSQVQLPSAWEGIKDEIKKGFLKECMMWAIVLFDYTGRPAFIPSKRSFCVDRRMRHAARFTSATFTEPIRDLIWRTLLALFYLWYHTYQNYSWL